MPPNPSLLFPAAQTEYERLWCRTRLSAAQVTASLNQQFGLTLNVRQVRWLARGRGLVRPFLANNRTLIEDRLLSASLARDGAGRRIDNAVRRPDDGEMAQRAVPEGGFRMGMGGTKPLGIDLFCGLGGWTDGLLAENYRVIGFDIERHVYGEHHYPAQLVLRDVLTLHGSQFRDATLIVAKPTMPGL